MEDENDRFADNRRRSYGSISSSASKDSRDFRGGVPRRVAHSRKYDDEKEERRLVSSTTHKYLVPILAVGLLLSSTANSILFKKMTNKLPNYPFFLMQVSTAIYVGLPHFLFRIPLCFLIVQVLFRFTTMIDDRSLGVPKYKFGVIALLDGVTGLFTLFGGVYTKGTTQMLLMQGAIPITMATSVVMLKAKYEWMQLVGATVILSGVFVIMSPKLFATPEHEFMDARSNDVFLFNAIFFLANLPAALGNVYKEAAFKVHENLDVFYAMLWTATMQTAIQWALLPFNSFSFLGEKALPLSELPSAFSNGAKCLLGIDSVVRHCYLQQPIPGMLPCDSCNGAWIIVTQYMIANIFFNFFAILLIKEGSAALLIIVMTLRLPLGNIAFYMPWIMGDDAQPFNPHDVSGLVVILLGLVLYRWQRAPDSPEADAPYVLTSIITIAPGVVEPIINQIKRRPISMKRSSEHIRGQLYARLGVPPSPQYKEPGAEDAGSTPINGQGASGAVPTGFGSVRSRDVVPSSFPYSGSPLIGVSPIARSAPLYSALTRQDDESGDEYDDEEDEGSVTP